MARSVEYWYDAIITEKNTLTTLNTLQPNIDTAQTLLNDVTTTSRVSRWRLWVWAVAACMYALDVVFDLFKIDLEDISKKSRFGTLPWYANQALKFQYGDTLVLLNNEWQYATVNPANQIIKRSSAQEAGNQVNVKIAKLSGTTLVKLTPTEKTAVIAFFEKTKPAGPSPNIISDDPDDVRLYLKVNYDPLLLTSTGELISTPGVFPVEDAINAFVSNLNNNFDGNFELCTLVDVIQALSCVISAYVLDAQARYGTNPFVSFSERYNPNAGYMIVDAAMPLSSTITYQSYV